MKWHLSSFLFLTLSAAKIWAHISSGSTLLLRSLQENSPPTTIMPRSSPLPPQHHDGSPSPTISPSNIYSEIKQNSEINCLIRLNPFTTLDPRTKVNSSKKCILYYLHFHKSGGTTICSMVIHEGYKSHINDNCLTPLQYRHHEYDYAIAHNLTFISQEQPLFQPNLTSHDIVYFTTIRNPYDRIISHLHHEICERKEIEAIQLMKTYNCSVNVSIATLADIILDPCLSQKMKHIVSNFYLRILTNCIGEECTQNSLKEAIEKLDIMSVIMITDTPDDYARYANLLNLKFGIHYQSQYRSGTRQDSSSQMLMKYNRTAYDILVHLNRLDYQFYLHSINLASKRYHLEDQKYHLETLSKRSYASNTNHPGDGRHFRFPSP